MGKYVCEDVFPFFFVFVYFLNCISDAVRTYDKYLTARIRCSSLKSRGHGRLNAGGRFMATFTKPHFNLLTTSSSLSRHRQRGGSKLNECGCKKPSCFSPKKPVIVVPSTTHFRNVKKCSSSGSLKTTGSCSTVAPPKKPCCSSSPPTPKQCCTPAPPPPKACCTPAPPPPKPCCTPVPPLPKPSCKSAPPPAPHVECCKHITFREPSCTCQDEMPHISRQLSALIKTLEMQVAVEARQKDQLNSINEQLKCLSNTVQNLNEKCKNLKPEPCCHPEPPPPPPQFCCGGEELVAKTSSVCFFCKDKNLPVLYSMHKELYRMIGCRNLKDIALTILLRPDNIYHVNVRDLKSDEVLGCLLVSDVGIREANMLGIFYDITTFCVIDSRSTLMEYKDGIFGSLKFEYVRDDRLAGGHTSKQQSSYRSLYTPSSSSSSSPSSSRRELTQVFCLTELLKASKLPMSKTKTKLTLINDKSFTQFKKFTEVLFHIENIDSKLMLSDDEPHHPIRHIQFTNLMDSSD